MNYTSLDIHIHTDINPLIQIQLQRNVLSIFAASTSTWFATCNALFCYRYDYLEIRTVLAVQCNTLRTLLWSRIKSLRRDFVSSRESSSKDPHARHRGGHSCLFEFLNHLRSRLVAAEVPGNSAIRDRGRALFSKNVTWQLLPVTETQRGLETPGGRV